MIGVRREPSGDEIIEGELVCLSDDSPDEVSWHRALRIVVLYSSMSPGVGAVGAALSALETRR